MGSERKNEHSFSATLCAGWQCCAQGYTAVVLGAGATASLASSKWPDNHNSHLRKMGFPDVDPYPAMARFKFRGGRVGEVRNPADIRVGVAGRRGAFTVFVLDADKGALVTA